MTDTTDSITVTIDGDVSSDPRDYVSGYTSATGSCFRISGHLATALQTRLSDTIERLMNNRDEAIIMRGRVGWAFKGKEAVRKKSGSWWEGKVVGFYSTRDTPQGYAVQVQAPDGNGPVQIFPEAALERSET